VKLRVACFKGADSVARLVCHLNTDAQFLEAYGKPVTEAEVREGMRDVGRFASGRKKRK
jgi:hypothetical protein